MKKLSLLFALLCASVMGFADPIDWTDATTNPYVPNSNSVYQIAGFTGQSVVGQQNAWGHEGIYITFGLPVTVCSLGEEGCHVEGGGILMYLTALEAEDTQVSVTTSNGLTTNNYSFTVHNNSASSSSATPTQVSSPYCDTEVKHQNLDNAAANSHILLSVGSDGQGHTIVNLKPTATNAVTFDYINVVGKKEVGSDIASGGAEEMAIMFRTPTPDANGDITFTVQWSYPNWSGRYEVAVTVPADATCETANPFPGENTYCSYTDNQMRAGNANVTLTWATDVSGNVVIDIADGEGATNSAYRNGGFENQGSFASTWFVYSGTNNSICESASAYFSGGALSNNNKRFTLTKTADLPANAIIAFCGAAFSWTNTQATTAYHQNKYFGYKYGYNCPSLSAPTNVAINANNEITFDAVANAETYTARVYLNGILKHRQVVTSGATLTFVPYTTGTYEVQVVADATGYPTSEPSEVYNWNLTATAVVVGNSEYCEAALKKHNGKDANITWETGDDGSITITLIPLSGQTATFRANGMKLSDFSVGSAHTAASAYFNRTYTAGGTTVILTLKDANIAPGLGEPIYFSGYVECTVDGTETWPSENMTFTYGAKCSGQKHVTVAVNNSDRGSATVNGEAAVDVDENTQVTLVAVPAEGYEFVNWTKGGVEVSTSATYQPTISTASDFVANFDYERTTYCHTPVLTNQGKKVYLTVGKGTTAGTYQIKIYGSAELPITGIYNANTKMNYIKYDTYDGNDVPLTVANGGWTYTNTEYGVVTSAEIQPRTGYTWRDMWMWQPALEMNEGVLQNINGILDNEHYFNWDNDCADDAAPVMAAPAAAALNTTDVRLTLSATDNWEGIITYNINYKPTGAEGDGVNVEVISASGVSVTKDIEGLTTNTEYTFTVTAKDAANNVCAAQTCKATPAGDVTAPTNVSITAVALSKTVVRLTLSADDDYAGDITYDIAYDNAGVASTSAAQGTTTTLDITGLTANEDYHFSVVATDAANNSAAAVNASVVHTYAENLAYGKNTVAGAEANPSEDSNDENRNTRWASGGWGSGHPEVVHGDGADSQDWWYVDLEHVYDIKNIRMWWEGARPSKYKFFVSNDATNWTEIADIKSSPKIGNGLGDVNDYIGLIDDDAQGRYLKVWGYEDTNNNNAYGISFWELEAYGTLATDVTAPVVNSFEASGASTTSVLLRTTATDNFNGDLTYTFYCNDVAQGEPVVKASGVEATFTVTGLTMGTNYNFKVNVSDGVNSTMSDVVVGTPISDNAAPENVTVTSVATDNSITLTMTATDNLGGMIYYTVTSGETVKNAEALSGANAEVTFDGLNYNTPYAFSIVAKDGSDNEAAAIAHNKSTLRAPYPTSAAPAPAFAEASVRPVYSSAYNKDCNFYDWGGSYVEKQTYGAKKLTGAATYFGIADFGNIKVDADDELYLSVWTNEPIQFRVVPIISNAPAAGNQAERGAYTQTLTDGQWNLVHFSMSDFVLDQWGNDIGTYDNFNQIYQIKIDNAGNQIFWLDNIYFHRKGALNETDNADFIAANNNEGQDITIARTFPNTDEWYTLCLPFDLDDAQLTAALGAGYTVAEMVGAEDRGSLIHLNFDYIHSFEAGKAYLVRPGVSVTDAPTFEGVTVKNVNPADLKSANQYMEFQGTFNSITLDNENQRFVGPENYLYSPAEGGTNMKSFRCYFTISDNAPANVKARPARIVFGEQTATDLENVESQTPSRKVMENGVLYIIRDGRTYNAQGMLVK